jgi:hypothetical protein
VQLQNSIGHSIPKNERGNRTRASCHFVYRVARFQQPPGFPGNTPPCPTPSPVYRHTQTSTRHCSMKLTHLSNTAPSPSMENTRRIWSAAAGIGEFGDSDTVFHFHHSHHFHRIHRLRRQQNRTTTTTTTTSSLAFTLYFVLGTTKL